MINEIVAVSNRQNWEYESRMSQTGKRIVIEDSETQQDQLSATETTQKKILIPKFNQKIEKSFSRRKFISAKHAWSKTPEQPNNFSNI